MLCLREIYHWSFNQKGSTFQTCPFLFLARNSTSLSTEALEKALFFPWEYWDHFYPQGGVNKSALFRRKIQMGVGKSSKFLKAYSRANCGYVNSFSHDGPSSPAFQDCSGSSHIDQRKSKWNLEAGWTQGSWHHKETLVLLLSCCWLLRLLPLMFFNWGFLLYCLININGPHKNAWLPHGRIKYAHKKSFFLGKLRKMVIFFFQ